MSPIFRNLYFILAMNKMMVQIDITCAFTKDSQGRAALILAYFSVELSFAASANPAHL